MAVAMLGPMEDCAKEGGQHGWKPIAKNLAHCVNFSKPNNL